MTDINPDEQIQVTVRVTGRDREDVLQKIAAAADDFFQGAPYMLRGGILVDAETDTCVHGESQVIGYSATADYVSLEGVDS